MPYILERKKQATIRRTSSIPRPVNKLIVDQDGLSHASKPSLDPVTPSKRLLLARQDQRVKSSLKKQSCNKPRDLKAAPSRLEPEADPEIPILELVPFGSQPFVDFGQVMVNSTRIKHVAIRNIQDSYQELFVRSFKADKGLNIDATEFLIAPRSQLLVPLSWTPTVPGSIRETIIFQHTGRFPSRIVVNGMAVYRKPEISKTGFKHPPLRRICNSNRSPSLAHSNLPLLQGLSRSNLHMKPSSPHKRVEVKALTRLRAQMNRRQSGQIVSKILSCNDDTMAIKVQSYVRMILVKRELEFLKRSKAALTLQKQWRMILARRSLETLRKQLKSIVILQSFARMISARRELERLKMRRDAVIKIQSYWRQASARRQLEQLKLRQYMVIRLQSYTRMMLARRQLVSLRKEKAALKIQSYWRMTLARRRSDALRLRLKMVIKLQSFARMIRAKRELQYLRRIKAAIMIQKQWRMILARRELGLLKKQLQMTVILQSFARMILAKRELNRLKIQRDCVVKVQSYLRGALVRARLTRSIEALMRVQSMKV